MGIGRAEIQATALGLSRRSKFTAAGPLALPDALPATFEFTVTATRSINVPSKAPASVTKPAGAAIPLDPYLSSLTWTEDSNSGDIQDDSAPLNGSLTLNLPDTADPNSIEIARGYKVSCNVQWGSQPFKLWKMEAYHPVYSETDGTLTIPLADEFAVLNRGQEDWIFRKSKNHPRKWRTNEIIAAVCDRLGVPHRILYRGLDEHAVSNFRKTGGSAWSGSEVIADMIARETKGTRRFIWRMVDGTLEVTPFKVNPTLYLLSQQLEGLEFEEAGPVVPFTAVVGKGHYGKNKKSPIHRLKHPVTDPALIKIYGYRPQVHTFTDVDNYSDLVAKSRRHLAHLVKVTRTATVTVPGLPFVRKGDLMELDKPQLGFTGSKNRVLVTSASHTLSGGGGYTTDLGLEQKDPYRQLQEEIDAAARKKAKAKRKKK